MLKFTRIIFLTVFVLAMSAPSLFAAGERAPEIDPSLAPSAIAIISGGLLILKSKIKRK